MRVAFEIFAILAILLAGCFQGSNPNDSQASLNAPSKVASDTQPPANSTHNVAVSLGNTSIDFLELDNCTALEMVHREPADLVGAKPPPSWGPAPTPMAEIFITAYECLRIHLGPLERGPIQFLIEVHDNRDPPTKCGNAGNYTSSEVIHQVWSNDSVVVDFLTTSLGLPAIVGTITTTSTNLPRGEIVNWTLASPGYSSSVITTLKTGGDTVRESLYIFRRFWVNERGGISYIDYNWADNRYQEEWPIGYGTLNDPFLHLPGDSSYVGTYNLLYATTVREKIARFSDLKCEHPY